MGIYQKVYEFAASAGAFEGYVYPKEKVDLRSLPRWVDHLMAQYQDLPAEVRQEFQALCDGTLGRAIQSLRPSLGEDHEVIKKLKRLVSGKLPASPDDFGQGR
jgi:hypothetical protein